VIFFVVYDPDTGRIIGRISSTDPAQIKLYSHAIQVNETDWSMALEKMATVDLVTKQLVYT